MVRNSKTLLSGNRFGKNLLRIENTGGFFAVQAFSQRQ